LVVALGRKGAFDEIQREADFVERVDALEFR
jgi:hypothetical protein